MSKVDATLSIINRYIQSEMEKEEYFVSIASDEMKAVQAMEIWEELLETELSLLAPHLKGIQTELMNYGSIHFLKRMINNRRCRTLS